MEHGIVHYVHIKIHLEHFVVKCVIQEKEQQLGRLLHMLFTTHMIFLFYRQPKLVLTDRVEQLPRPKRKTDDDYSSDASTTDDTDIQDDDDDDDEEFQHEKRKNPQTHNNHTRRSFPNDHLNESISSPASSTTTTRSYRSASPSSSSKITDHSKLSATKKRATIGSFSRSTKSTSSLLINKKINQENDQKKSLKHQSSKSKDIKQRQSNDNNNQKTKNTNNDRNKKNDVQQKK
jgi:hypothetical protein